MRYEDIGFSLPQGSEETLAMFLEGEQKSLARLEKAGSQQFAREDLVHTCVDIALMHHLQLVKLTDIKDIISRGVKYGRTYFLDDWWKRDEIDREYLDKSLTDADLLWAKPYLQAIFLGGLLNDWDSVRHISDWIDSTVSPEYTAGNVPVSYFLSLICTSPSSVDSE